MVFVVTENCINCKHAHCAEVCPVGCFHEGPNFLVIDPDSCIDCSICLPNCPVNAILEDRNVPADQRSFIRLNAEKSVVWPVIKVKRKPPPDSEEWDGVQEKLKMLDG